MTTDKILYNYLKTAGVKIDLGAAKDLPKENLSAEYNALVQDLKSNSSFKNKLIIVIYSLLIIFFIFCLVLFFLEKDYPDKIAYLFGGSVFSILTIIKLMIKVWKDKEKTDTLLKVLPFLKEEDRITAVIGFLKLSETKK